MMKLSRARRRFVFVFPVLLVPVLAALPVAEGAQKKSAKDKNKPDYKLTVFDDEFFRGKNVILRKSVPDMQALKFNDRSESISWNIPPGKAAVVCDEKNFTRPVLVLVGKGEVKDLGKEQPNALHSISSVAMVPCKKGRLPKGISKDVPRLGEEEEE